MRLSENMRALRKAAKISQGELAEKMAERGRPWHQTTVSRIERGSQELDSLADITALQDILGTELLDYTPLSAGRETDNSKRLKETFDLVQKLERIKADLVDLQQAVDDLITDIGPVEPRERLGGNDPEALLDFLADLDSRTDKKTARRDIAAALLRALEGVTLPAADDRHRPEREAFDGIYRDFEAETGNPAGGAGEDAEAYLRDREEAQRGVDQEAT